MKDYSEHTKEKKTFILNYKIKKNMIIVKYADGTIEKIPYHQGNEELILDKMKKQFQNIDENKFVEIKRRNIIFDYIVSLLSIVGVTSFSVVSFGISTPAIIISLGAMSIGIFYLVNGIQQHRTVIDYKKNKKFFEIEKELNANVKKHDNMLVNTCQRTRRIVKKSSEGKNIFNINSVDKVSLGDLNAIMDNIYRDKVLNYDYTQAQTETKPIIKTRKKK